MKKLLEEIKEELLESVPEIVFLTLLVIACIDQASRY